MKIKSLCLLLFISLGSFLPIQAKNILDLTNDLIMPVADKNEIEKQEQINKQIAEYCSTNQGKQFYKIQNDIKVDCLTNKNLWKVSYAKDWNKALVDAMAYGIYDTYMGREEDAPQAGIALVLQYYDDYKYVVKLRHLVKHYNLPIDVNEVRDFVHFKEIQTLKNNALYGFKDTFL